MPEKRPVLVLVADHLVFQMWYLFPLIGRLVTYIHLRRVYIIMTGNPKHLYNFIMTSSSSSSCSSSSRRPSRRGLRCPSGRRHRRRRRHHHSASVHRYIITYYIFLA